VAVTTTVDGSPVADARFEPLLAELDRRSTVLFIHPAGTAGGSSLVEALGLTWALGAAIEDTISVTALLARGIPTRYPNLRIVNAHLGGALPMLLRRLDSQFPRVAPDTPEPPSVAARRMWYDTVSEAHPAALMAARMAFGADRLLLGTDHPFVRGAGYRAAVDYVAASGLDPAETSAIQDRNAAAVLGLGGR
jgi:aminocarboxymuconate-semialdehyde decarboxylase